MLYMVNKLIFPVAVSAVITCLGVILCSYLLAGKLTMLGVFALSMLAGVIFSIIYNLFIEKFI